MLVLMSGVALVAAQAAGAALLWPQERVRPVRPKLEPIVQVQLQALGAKLRGVQNDLSEARTALTRAGERETLSAQRAEAADAEIAHLKGERTDLMRALSDARSAGLQAEADLMAYEAADKGDGTGSPPALHP